MKGVGEMIKLYGRFSYIPNHRILRSLGRVYRDIDLKANPHPYFLQEAHPLSITTTIERAGTCPTLTAGV